LFVHEQNVVTNLATGERRDEQMPDHPEETLRSSGHQSDSGGGGVCTRMKRRWQAFTQAGAKEVISEMLVRFLVGLVLGGIACFLLIPAIFWPSRHNPRPIFDEISDIAWAKWLFAGVLFLPAVIGALSTMLGDPRSGFGAALGLKHRTTKYQITDGLIVIEEEDQPTSWLGRLLCKLGNILVWVAICTPGLLIIFYGKHVIQVERISAGKFQRTTYGLEAVGWGWLFVGLGIVVLGWGLEIKSERSVFRLLGWVLGVAAIVYGMGCFFKA
jgi:hypothetical protein